MRDELVLSASDNLITPLLLILIPVLSENETKSEAVTTDIERNER
jgi:hypothetical protein